MPFTPAGSSPYDDGPQAAERYIRPGLRRVQAAPGVKRFYLDDRAHTGIGRFGISETKIDPLVDELLGYFDTSPVRSPSGIWITNIAT